MNRIDALKLRFRLEPHPEGGAFAEVYTAPFATPDGRSLAGSIYFLLEGGEISHFHRIDCDEVWYYHEGCGMRVTMIDAHGRVSAAELGPGEGQSPMVIIPRGIIFAAENLSPDGYCFVSCMTAPKFRYEGFRLIGRDVVAALCPEQAAALARLAWPGGEAGL